MVTRPGEIVVAVEVHSQINRLEQQLRWAASKAQSLPSCDAWSVFAAGRASAPISALLVLRITRATRELAIHFEATLAASYPARSADAIAALRDPHAPWPGAAVIWADVTPDSASLRERPRRGVQLGR